MKTLSRLLLVLAALGASACEGDAPGTTPADDRQPIAKADGVAGTCASSCGGDFNPDALCQCDTSCETFGDCCADFELLCSDDSCEPGERIQAADTCNTCTCDDDGRWSCTELACDEDGCEPGAVTEADDACNTCTCDDDGRWSCTELACNEDGCEPGAVTDADDACNTCTCDDDGRWSCTELACDDGVGCVPGQEIALDDGCNSCECSDDGRWACSELAC